MDSDTRLVYRLSLLHELLWHWQCCIGQNADYHMGLRRDHSSSASSWQAIRASSICRRQ